MKKQFNVTGMSCNHCRMSVEKALDSIEGVTATVTLDPPMATIESADEITIDKLQKAVSEAGDFKLSEE